MESEDTKAQAKSNRGSEPEDERGERRRTVFGELGELADDCDLSLALGRLEELDLALELGFLLDGQTRVVRDAVIVLHEEWESTLAG